MKFSLSFQQLNQRRAWNDVMYDRSLVIIRNWLILLPAMVLAMLFAFSNVPPGGLLGSTRGIVTLIYFVALLLGLCFGGIVRLYFFDMRACARMPRRMLEITVEFYEDYIVERCESVTRKLYYCDITLIKRADKNKYLEIYCSFHSDLRIVYKRRPKSLYCLELPIEILTEEQLNQVESFLKEKGKEIKYA